MNSENVKKQSITEFEGRFGAVPWLGSPKLNPHGPLLTSKNVNNINQSITWVPNRLNKLPFRPRLAQAKLAQTSSVQDLSTNPLQLSELRFQQGQAKAKSFGIVQWNL